MRGPGGKDGRNPRGTAARSSGQLDSDLADLPQSATGATWLHPKGNLTRGELALLLVVAAIPLVVMVMRISAFPGVLGASMSGTLIPSIGHELNQLLSLHRVPALDRGQILYLLFLPTAAILIALARLTLGLRVIGFRAILISVGFQQIGIVPSVTLIAVVALIIAFVRPLLVRFRLPYYARVSVILSIAAMVLLCSLLVAPSLRSDVLWRLGFFPVIILGLLAEGIAKTLERDSWLAAVWRTGMTIGVALILAGIGQFTPLQELAIRFPELVISQIVAIILIAEYLDLRLFQEWDARLSGVAAPRLFSNRNALRIAVVRNERNNGIIGHLGTPAPRGYSRSTIRRIAATLRESGHSVKIVEGDMRMLSRLRDFIPAHPRTDEPGGLVLNLSHGIQGDRSTAHVPAMLEMSGVAYTGATAYGRLVMQDRVLTADLLKRAGLRTPHVDAVRSPGEAIDPSSFPLVVKPRHAFRPKLRRVADRRELDDAIRAVVRRHRQEAVIERSVPGRRIEVALIGNDPVESLPPVETSANEPGFLYPADLDAALERRIRKAALRAFEACGCRDYAVVDLRISAKKIYVVEVAEAGVLEPGGVFERAANAAGYSFRELIERIVDVARARYRSAARVPALEVVPHRAGEGGPGERFALGT